jgi:hypothetical protein
VNPEGRKEYMNSKGNPTILNFVNALERKGCKIEDITKAYAKTYPKDTKIHDNKKVFTVDQRLPF